MMKVEEDGKGLKYVAVQRDCLSVWYSSKLLLGTQLIFVA